MLFQRKRKLKRLGARCPNPPSAPGFRSSQPRPPALAAHGSAPALHGASPRVTPGHHDNIDCRATTWNLCAYVLFLHAEVPPAILTSNRATAVCVPHNPPPHPTPTSPFFASFLRPLTTPPPTPNQFPLIPITPCSRCRDRCRGLQSSI